MRSLRFFFLRLAFLLALLPEGAFPDSGLCGLAALRASAFSKRACAGVILGTAAHKRDTSDGYHS